MSVDDRVVHGDHILLVVIGEAAARGLRWLSNRPAPAAWAGRAQLVGAAISLYSGAPPEMAATAPGSLRWADQVCRSDGQGFYVVQRGANPGQQKGGSKSSAERAGRPSTAKLGAGAGAVSGFFSVGSETCAVGLHAALECSSRRRKRARHRLRRLRGGPGRRRAAPTGLEVFTLAEPQSPHLLFCRTNRCPPPKRTGCGEGGSTRRRPPMAARPNWRGDFLGRAAALPPSGASSRKRALS